MSKSRQAEAHMIGALKQLEAGPRPKSGAGSWGIEAHHLRVEGEVRW